MESKRRLTVSLIGFLLLCLLLCASAQVTLAASATPYEPTYTITETELTQLQTNLTELKTINEALQTACSGQQIKAAELQVKLTKAEELSRTLQSQLTELQAKSTRQEALLTQANESLKEYAREEKRTRLRIKAQRNTWEAVAAGLLLAWAAK